MGSQMTDLAGVILAGGRAQRMGGGDKGLRLLAGRPLIAHVIDRLSPQVTALAINANGDPARFAGLGLPVLPDPLTGQPGPLAGVLAAMDWAAARGADRVLTTPADTPFLPLDLAARLNGADGLAMARAGGLHPVCAIWPVRLAPDLRDALAAGEHRVGRLADALGAVPVDFPDRDAFFNVNTPDDLRRAERLLDAP